jgi:hypothetical protein
MLEEREEIICSICFFSRRPVNLPFLYTSKNTNSLIRASINCLAVCSGYSHRNLKLISVV